MIIRSRALVIANEWWCDGCNTMTCGIGVEVYVYSELDSKGDSITVLICQIYFSWGIQDDRPA